MEIYKCLDDIITRVEQGQEPKIIKVRAFGGGSIALIDLNKLKANPRLNGAKIFKMLFGISKNASFAKLPMKTDRNGNITLLIDLEINIESWTLFQIFLDQGIVPGYLNYMARWKGYEVVTSNLETLNEICIKLGGIPSFELFYHNFYNDEAEEWKEWKEQNYNPRTPEEDTKGMFQWLAYPEYDASRSYPQHMTSSGWSLSYIKPGVVTYANRATRTSPPTYYYRRESIIWQHYPNDADHSDSDSDSDSD